MSDKEIDDVVDKIFKKEDIEAYGLLVLEFYKIDS